LGGRSAGDPETPLSTRSFGAGMGCEPPHAAMLDAEKAFTRDVLELIGTHLPPWDYRALHRLQQVAWCWRDAFGPLLQALPDKLASRIDKLKLMSKVHSYRELSVALLHGIRRSDLVEALSLRVPPAGICEAFHLLAVLVGSATIPRQGDGAPEWSAVKKSLCKTFTHHTDRALTMSAVARGLVEGMEAFRPECLTEVKLQGAESWVLGKQWMDPDFMRLRSTAAAGLVQWLQLQLVAARAALTSDGTAAELDELLALRERLAGDMAYVRAHPLVCRLTGKRFKTARELTAHRLAHHNVSGANKAPPRLCPRR